MILQAAEAREGISGVIPTTSNAFASDASVIVSAAPSLFYFRLFPPLNSTPSALEWLLSTVENRRAFLFETAETHRSFRLPPPPPPLLSGPIVIQTLHTIKFQVLEKSLKLPNGLTNLPLWAEDQETGSIIEAIQISSYQRYFQLHRL